MPKPELKPDDVFHMIGFTSQDILTPAHAQITQRLGMPRRPSADAKLIEVYSLDSVTAPDPEAFSYIVII